MISKELFLKTMDGLNKEREFQDKFNDLLREYCDDSLFMNFRIESMVMDLLEEVFNDKENGWIGYAVYELEMLTKYRAGCVKDENDDDIDISDFGKLYDFLLSNMSK